MSSLPQPRSPWKTPGRRARNSHPALAGLAVGIVDPRAGIMGAAVRDNKDPNPVCIPKVLQGSGAEGKRGVKKLESQQGNISRG